MSQSTVAADIHQPLDVHGDFAPQVPLHLELFHVFPEAVNLILGQLRYLGVLIHPCTSEDKIGSSPADSIDIGQSDLDPFILG